jgi:hypothetical protein
VLVKIFREGESIILVDDHVIDGLRRYFDDVYEELKKEWKSNDYEQLSDCPSFKLAYTYREALDVLITGPESFDEHKSEKLKELIDEDLGLENFWKERKRQ